MFIFMILIFIIFNLNQDFMYTILTQSTITREILLSFVHLKFSHLIANMLTLLSLSNIEKIEGKKYYFYKIIYFVIMNACLIDSFNRFYTTPISCGYSSVLFGFVTMYPINNFYGYNFDKKYYPFILLLITQLLFENVSFVGHLGGILSSYIYISIRDFKD